jgi:hypothetical protein
VFVAAVVVAVAVPVAEECVSVLFGQKCISTGVNGVVVVAAVRNSRK